MRAIRRSAVRAAATKIHALTDAACRPIAFLLTSGHVAECAAGRGVAVAVEEREKPFLAGFRRMGRCRFLASHAFEAIRT